MPPSDGLGYAQSRLVRHSSERGDEDLRARAADPGARLVLLAGESPVLARGGGAGDAGAAGAEATCLLDPALLGRLPDVEPRVLLGRIDGRPVLAAAAGPEGAAALGAERGLAVADLRTIAVQGLVPPDELGLLAAAKSILSWHARHGFCANCGAATLPASAGFRRDCAACGTEHFPRTDPVVIMLIRRRGPDGDHCLLGRQARFPPGVYSCLAGFLEPGETIEDAVRRETFEEAGVRVGAVAYRLSQPWPFPSSLMIGCLGEAEGGSEVLTLDRTELEDGRWFSREEVRAMLARRHPDGLGTPPPMAIAHHLMRHFAQDSD